MSRNKVLYGNYSRYLNRKVHATDHCCPDSKVVCEGKRGPQGPIGETGPVGPQPTAGQTYEITFGTPTDMSYNSSLVFHHSQMSISQRTQLIQLLDILSLELAQL